MSRQELLQLQSDLQKALKGAEKRDKKKARVAAEQAAAEYGFKLEGLVGTPKNSTGRPKLPPKYRNPEKPEQTWSGRGRRPQWVHDALAQNMDIAKFEI